MKREDINLEAVACCSASSAYVSVNKHIMRPTLRSTTLCKTLAQVQDPRQIFNAHNDAHRKSYYEFRKSGKWSIRFHNEWPFVDVQQTIMAKMIDYMEQSESK